MNTNTYDCIVIGAGHAGAEASHAAAKLNAKTLLLTISKDSIARLSCNPAIGGLAKGQITREIDALGGLMAQAIDATAIQFRLLNRSKGPAVQSPRAQADKHDYEKHIANILDQTENLTIVETIAEDILTRDEKVHAVKCKNGKTYNAPTVIITTGTFLGGVMHAGEKQWPGGRLNEPAANELSQSLKRLGLTVERLKTGTPPRLDGTTIDYSKTEIQPPDENPEPFSFLTEKLDRPQLPCWITYTNEKVHKLLRDNLDRAPLYTGQIKSTGPRYCPSVETKILRFADKTRHQVFLEPEDKNASTIYVNGISTSMPPDVQEKMVKMISGIENAKFVHYGYAIEYDYCPAQQLKPNLETRKIQGLFLAGQINGTSGYEEAAAQGIIAGINVVAKLKNKPPLILRRDQAYIGVLIDDLLTKQITEPYRMFTSRAEYRLFLRSDNADRRLTPTAKDIGLASEKRWTAFQNKLNDIEKLTAYLKATRTKGKTLWHQLKQPNNPLYENLAEVPEIKQMNLPPATITAAAIDAKYEGYLAKQQKQIDAFRNLQNIKLPTDIDYQKLQHLRREAAEKLTKFRPHTLHQAIKIGGITPADITVIQIHLKKQKQPHS